MCLLGPCAACPNALPAKIVAQSISICHRGAYNQGCDAPRISGWGKRAPSLKAGGVSARTVNTMAGLQFAYRQYLGLSPSSRAISPNCRTISLCETFVAAVPVRQRPISGQGTPHPSTYRAHCHFLCGYLAEYHQRIGLFTKARVLFS